MNYSRAARAALGFLAYAVLFLLVLEVALRLCGAFLSRRPALDSLGQEETSDIICIGDSFTYGWAVEAGFSYPKQLERMLNERSGHEKRFRVFNLAIPGSNSSQHLGYFASLLRTHSTPDMLILLSGANDNWNLAHSNLAKVLGGDTEPTSKLLGIKVWLADLRIYKMPRLIVLNLRGKAPESEIDFFSQVRKSKNVDPAILQKLLDYNLSAIIGLARQYRVKVIIHSYPQGGPYRKNVAEEVAVRLGIPFVDHARTFREALETKSFRDLFIYDNSHPNKEGYRMIAENLYPVVLREMAR